MKKLDISNSVVNIRRVTAKLKNYLDSRYILVPQRMIVTEYIDSGSLQYRILRDMLIDDNFFYGMSLLYCNEGNDQKFKQLPEGSSIRYNAYASFVGDTINFDDPQSYINNGRCFMIFKTQKEFLKYKMKN